MCQRRDPNALAIDGQVMKYHVGAAGLEHAAAADQCEALQEG